eukprot:177001_1
MGICACKAQGYRFDPLPPEDAVKFFSEHQGSEYVCKYWIRTYIEHNEDYNISIIPSIIKEMIIDYVCKDNIDTVILSESQTHVLFGILDEKIDKQNTHARALYENVRVNKSNWKLKLLYRASRDGLSTYTFHSKCDDIGQTITVYKDWTWGVYHPIIKIGYTSLPWTQYGGTHQDHKAFTCIITDHDKIIMGKPPISEVPSVKHGSNLGPCFENTFTLASDWQKRNYQIVPHIDVYLGQITGTKEKHNDDYEVFHIY